MTTFSYAIKMAIILFPLVALIFTIPYILYQYHKYGSVNSYRSLVIYSFLLYLLSAYFLVILPLPSIESVSQMTTPSYNLIPFQFISEILSLSSFSVSDFATYFPTLKNPVVYESVFNIFLTVPFGMYLHYYFEFSFKKTLFYSFCLTLFFELTQLSGLYFIYPRGYRVFDIDDLILNTLGGVFGYVLAFIPLKILPNRHEIDEESKIDGEKVSVLKRICTFVVDLFLFGLVIVCLLYLGHQYLTSSKWLYLGLICIWSIFYFVILPTLLKGKTLGMQFFHLEFTSSKKITWYRLFSYYFWQLFFYGLIPLFSSFLGYILYTRNIISKPFYEYYEIIILALTLMIYLMLLLKRIFKMPTIFEKISHLSLQSTIKKN